MDASPTILAMTKVDYAEIVAKEAGSRLHIADITAADFRDRIGEVIYHLDFPVAGPGSFPQYMVSRTRGEACEGRPRRLRAATRSSAAMRAIFCLFRAVHQGGDRRVL